MSSAPRLAPRIAITGSAGTGKTTLAAALADSLGVTLVPEGMRSRLEAGLDLHALGRSGIEDLVLELFEEQCSLIATACDAVGGYVSDRCAWDFAAFWLFYNVSFDADATARLFQRAGQASRGHSLIVVLPWNALPLQKDDLRCENPWVQLHYQTVIEGLLHRFFPSERLVWVSGDCVDLTTRLQLIRSRLEE